MNACRYFWYKDASSATTTCMAIVEPENYQRDVWQTHGTWELAIEPVSELPAWRMSNGPWLAACCCIGMCACIEVVHIPGWLTMLPCPSSYTMQLVVSDVSTTRKLLPSNYLLSST